MHNVKMLIAYDGSAYLGWQKTSMGPSIEETLQQVLEQILQEPIALQAASRTDAGVHARGQVVNFLTSKGNIQPNRLRISLNSLLPKDLVVLQVEFPDPSFHPTLDCIGKEYHYDICYGTAQLPQHRFYSWHYPHRLDLSAMREAAEKIKGERDFSSFCNFKKNAHYKHCKREIHTIEIIEIDSERICLKISGNNFLYKMVRNIVGTIAYVGSGKIPLKEIPAILSSQDRTQAGMTAPAHGLTLHRVFYEFSILS
jgi:tRNA pseudouridine38-40 synthase